MQRRDFSILFMGAGAGLGACAHASPNTSLLGAPPAAVGGSSSNTGQARVTSAAASSRPKIAAICFDLFTLFDPRSVAEVAHAILPGDSVALCDSWRMRQFQYAFLRAAAAQYRDFRAVTLEALAFALRERNVSLSKEDKERLVNSYSELRPWPDTRARLTAWKHAGLRLAPLANYAPKMLADLLDQAGLSELFDGQISTHAAQTFKPDPRAYALGVSTLGLPREQIAFAAFGGWDAAGARWFGYPTFWVNRLGVAAETLEPGPHASGPSLTELDRFVATWESASEVRPG